MNTIPVQRNWKSWHSDDLGPAPQKYWKSRICRLFRVLGVRAIADGNLRRRVENPVQQRLGQPEVRTLRRQKGTP
jgi:hypothetical protein